ncbi:flavin reductase family protein [Ignatzschineria sp. LJL83]
MQYDFRDISPDLIYKLMASTIVPRPIAWITTKSKTGVVNAAPFSFFNMMGSEPPVVAVGLQGKVGGKLKDTTQNILDTKEFVVNLVPHNMAISMNETSREYSEDDNELEIGHISTMPAILVKAPLIKDVPVSFECVSISEVQTGASQYVILGEVKICHIADEFLLDRNAVYVDTEKMNLISRMHGRGWYSQNKDLFLMERPK